MELVDGGKDVLQVDGIVRLGGLISPDGVFGGIDIEGEVDASIGKGFHARVVVLAVINGVDTDGIDAQLLEPRCSDQWMRCSDVPVDSLGNVTRADGSISQWIGGI